MREGICKYCGQYTKLVKSHIVPKSLYQIDKWGPYTGIDAKQVFIDKVHSQNGFKEPLLCEICDNKLGYLDRYASNFFLKDIPNMPISSWPELSFYELDSSRFNYNNLRRFFISLMWRVSICKRVDYSLGKYEAIASDILKYNIPDDKDLFLPVIYHRKSNTPFDYLSSIYSIELMGNKELCVRFPEYEIILIKNKNLCDDQDNAQVLSYMFSRERLFVLRINSITHVDQWFVKTLKDLNKKYDLKRIFKKKE